MLEQTDLTPSAAAAPVADLERLAGAHVDVTVELGRTRMTLGEALEIGPGAVIPLGRTAGESLDLLVNGQLVARGEVLVVDDVYGLQITEVVQQGAPVVGRAAPALAGHAPIVEMPDQLAA